MGSWVRTVAPVRVLDAGGWTDTWFAGHGLVCHLAAGPGSQVAVQLSAGLDSTRGLARARLRVPDLGDDYVFQVSDPPGRHRLLEATIARWAPPGRSLDVEVTSSVPAGSGLGTSASVVVGLTAALQHLSGTDSGGGRGPFQLARAAHETETRDVGRQSGLQDQVAAAYGGANLVRVGPYPDFVVEPLELSARLAEELSQRVLTVYLGGAHDSSALHAEVIRHLGMAKGVSSSLLEPLRAAAGSAASALRAGNLEAYGQALIDNTRAQVGLHQDLVSPLAQEVIGVAARHGALGWKVNGAGGYGGSLSVLGPPDTGALEEALRRVASVTVLYLKPLWDGARVVDAGGAEPLAPAEPLGPAM